MDQINLDAMFDNMLGELNIISQQLEESSEPIPAINIEQQETISSSFASKSSVSDSPEKYSEPQPAGDVSDDIDLSAMLSDLTDWEHNLTSGHGQMPAKKSASQDSGIGFNGNSLPRNSHLTPQYGFEASPQFNTIKRPKDSSGPAVSFEEADDDMSLASLEKDLEQQKQDKSRQLSPEELATLSPVMQELDDLVSDLSNMSFNREIEFKKKPVQTKPHENLSILKENEVSSPMSPNEIRVNGLDYMSIVPKDTSRKSEASVTFSTSVTEHSIPMKQNSLFTEPEWIPTGPHSKSELTVSQSKPPPPVPSKPKVPVKPHINIIQPNAQTSKNELPAAVKPAKPVKRQTSVKAPANLSMILARQLQRHNSVDDHQISPMSPGNGFHKSPNVPQSPVNPSLNDFQYDGEHAHMVGRDRLVRQNSASRTSVKSTASTNSAISLKSNGSGGSTASRNSSDSLFEQAAKKFLFVPNEIQRQLDNIDNQIDIVQLSPEEREERIKAEKMRVALEKLKEARIQKLVVKVYNKDDSSKTMMVDERMTTRTVIKHLLEKNHYDHSINWAFIEEIPSLFMERIFEEQESVTEMLSYWTRDTTNQVRFMERKDKYALFRNPQHYLLSTTDTEGQMAERQKQTLIEEFFSGRSGTGVPEVQGILYMKGDSKSWTRKYCVLRTSGLYCSKSGEPKKGKKLSDLQCLVMFEQVCVYLGRGWRKKYKSPTDYGFALKHPAIQTKSKHIRYFCCEDVRSLMRWIVGIRCAKYGKQLKENYDKTVEEMKSNTPVQGLPFHTQQAKDTTSSGSGESSETNSRQNTLPRANLSNVFEGAWQRANQQDGSDSKSDSSSVSRAKSVWKPKQANTNNWWDLSDAAVENAEDDGDSTTISNRTSGTSNIGSVVSASHNHRMSTSSSGSRGSYKENTTPPPTYTSQFNVYPPPPSMVQKNTPPPPPMKNMPPPPPVKHMPPPPPSSVSKPVPPVPLKYSKPLPPGMASHFGNKPTSPNFSNILPPPSMQFKLSPAKDSMPPPPDDDMPPPPPMDDLPPPPSTVDMPPPPPPMDDMPLPPPMDIPPPPEEDSGPQLPRGLRTVNGQAPVRLPMLPMFNKPANRGGFSGFRGLRPTNQNRGGAPPPPPKKGGFPPHPAHNNYNYSNNKPPLLPRDPQNVPVPPRSPVKASYSQPSYYQTNNHYQPPMHSNHQGYMTKASNHQSYKMGVQPPLARYYNSGNVTADRNEMYRKDDFPPPPDFVLDLKSSIYTVHAHVSGNTELLLNDLPPPPPELLLQEVKYRKQPPPLPKSSKPAPPPPKRSPSTKLSIKRR